jgi:hypothetical protein
MNLLVMQASPSSCYFIPLQFKYSNIFDRKNIHILWRTELLLSSDSVNSGRCQVMPATYTHATIDRRGYATSCKQRIGKHAYKRTVLLETVFSIRSMQNGYKENFSPEEYYRRSSVEKMSSRGSQGA